MSLNKGECKSWTVDFNGNYTKTVERFRKQKIVLLFSQLGSALWKGLIGNQCMLQSPCSYLQCINAEL